MRASDGFLLSSAWEGLPMVLLEAASTELPIVATRVGGNEDAVNDGISGILVRSGDPAALADGMRTVMAKDEDARHAMGLAGRELVTPPLRSRCDDRHLGRPLHGAAEPQGVAARRGRPAEPALSDIAQVVGEPAHIVGQRWTTAQSYGIRSENGSRRSVSDGSCGCVAQLATIADSVMPLKPVQMPGGITISA